MVQSICANTGSTLSVWVLQSRIVAIMSTYMGLGECAESMAHLQAATIAGLVPKVVCTSAWFSFSEGGRSRCRETAIAISNVSTAPSVILPSPYFLC